MAKIDSGLADESIGPADFHLLVPGHLHSIYSPRFEQCHFDVDLLHVSFDSVEPGSVRCICAGVESSLAADCCNLVTTLDPDRNLVLEDTISKRYKCEQSIKTGSVDETGSVLEYW